MKKCIIVFLFLFLISGCGTSKNEIIQLESDHPYFEVEAYYEKNSSGKNQFRVDSITYKGENLVVQSVVTELYQNGKLLATYEGDDKNQDDKWTDDGNEWINVYGFYEIIESLHFTYQSDTLLMNQENIEEFTLKFNITLVDGSKETRSIKFRMS